MIQNEGNVSVGTDVEMEEAIYNIFVQESYLRPKVILEFGTYLGLGTTLTIVNAVNRAKEEKIRKYPKLYTVEANETNYDKAKENLKEHKWVEVIHGTSVKLNEAIEFIENDELLLNHQNYPIKVDATEPIPFYVSEAKGELAVFGPGSQGRENVLGELIGRIKDKNPLFVLDSCGGMGWLEFQKVVESMGHEVYYIFLHDIDHVKHWRSYKYIIHPDNNLKWDILAHKEDEWILVKHRKKARSR